MNTAGAVYTQSSNNPSAVTPQGAKSQDGKLPQYDLKELKKRVGVQPFCERIKIDSDGYSPCPFHDGDSETSFHVQKKESGAVIGTCFSECGKSWDAISFVQRFDAVGMGEAIRRVAGSSHVGKVVELPKKEPAVPMTAERWKTCGRPVTDEDAASLAASRPHSVTPSAATLNAMGFRIGEKYKQSFLVAPYRLGNTFYTLKARNLTTKEFVQEHAVSQQGLFNIDAVIAGCDVFVVESELDAAVLHENGYTAVSVINAKQKSIETEVLKKLNTAARIFLAGDQDTAGQICMDAIAKLLPSEKVHRISFTDAKDVGELAQTIKTSAGFLGDFKSNWELLKADALASWVHHNIPFVTQIPDTPQEWAIDKLMPQSGFLVISAKYGGMKSILALTLAQGLERGTQVLGRKVNKPTKVLYVDRENLGDVVSDRRKGLGIKDNQVHYWGDWAVEMPTPNLEDWRLADFASKEHGIIIFDSLCDFLEGMDENSSTDMAAITHKLRRLARLGAGVIVLHHNDKRRGDFRGSTAIIAGADMAIKTTKSSDNILHLEAEKFRSCGEWEMDVQFRFGEHGAAITYEVLRDESVAAKYKHDVVQEKTDSTDALNAVRAVLSKFHEENDGAGMGKNALLKEMEAVCGINPRRAGRDAVEQAIANRIIEPKDGLTKTKSRTKLHYLVGWKSAK